MVEQWNRDSGTVKHVMVKQWIRECLTDGGTVEHLMIEK